MSLNFIRLRRVALALLLAAAPFAVVADLLEHEVSFSEAEVQAALDRNAGVSKNYGGLLTVALQHAPKIALGVPEGRIALAGRMEVTLAGQSPIPVDVQGVAGIRYDEKSKAFYLENPEATSVSSPALQAGSEPFVRQAVSQMITTYFRNRPVYVLRQDGSAEEAAARWLLRSVRIETGRVVAVLAPF